ncbi:branched-chain amino acid ABC transporter permease [Bengtsoniella intestinalis]|uniref:branched-chain amino acid ABC transporter permease n=1 Tax=Bengtsoniella intestinalis TaxID=3073143 RepID=UPI00391F13DF
MTYLISVTTFTLITCIVVVGLYIMTGLTGMFSLGQASIMAVGAYASGLVMKKLSFPFPVAVLFAIVLALIIAYIISKPIMRLRRDYFTLVTLAMGEAVIAFLNAADGLTGGALGLVAIPKKTTVTLILVTLLIGIWMARNFCKSRYGRMCIATRADELASGSMGINVYQVKTRSFLIAAGFASLAGAYYASYVTYIDPSMFAWRKSGEWVIMMFFGGVNSLTGSIFSTILLNVLPEALRFADNYRYTMYAILVLFVINFRPNGLFGHWEIFDLFNKDSRAAKKMKKAAAAKGGNTK